jgi:hypothetical protein
MSFERKMGGNGDHNVKHNKSGLERQISRFLSYKESRAKYIHTCGVGGNTQYKYINVGLLKE